MTTYTNNPKTYRDDWKGYRPNRTLIKWLIENEIAFGSMWQMPGPKDTNVTWMEAIHVGATIVIVQTFKDGGWDAYVPASNTNSAAVTIEAVARAAGLEGYTGPVKPDDGSEDGGDWMNGDR